MSNDSSTQHDTPLVGVIMGSVSDWETMQHVSGTLARFDVAHECRIVSAHRTPDLLTEYSKAAEARGLEVIVAGAGGAAHLPAWPPRKHSCPCWACPSKAAL
jgi:5-(carboxyamino)imidazole ribonucleotide mutase